MLKVLIILVYIFLMSFMVMPLFCDAKVQEGCLDIYDAQPTISEIRDWVLNEVAANGISRKSVDCLISHESGWRPYAVNINKGGSQDSGIWQWNSRWHPEVTDPFDYKSATYHAIRVIKRQGFSPWYGYNKCK